ncbi:MAG: TetR family transcriptional regulator [Actinomycetota bacterium]|nr:TetR family transcriptional regulator [Actinomycetota bacterium]
MTGGPDRRPRPSGCAEVTEALLDAAEVELVRHGAAHASIRRIAAAARVNHGLVHRYFGAKSNLVAAVLARLSSRTADQLAGDAPLVEVLATDGPVARHLRILARLILDGEDVATLQPEHPAIGALVADAVRDGGAPLELAQVRVAQVIALVFGWHLFEPFLLDASGASPDLARAELPGAVAALAALRPAGGRGKPTGAAAGT